MSKRDELQKVINFLERNDFEDHSLKPEKIQERGEILEDDDYPESIVFQVERHRELSEEHRYDRRQEGGQAMIAMMTYWPVFVFHPEIKEIEKLGQRKDPAYDIDYQKVAKKELRSSFLMCVKEDEEGIRKISDSINHMEREVESKEEAREFGAEVASMIDLSGCLNLDINEMSDEESSSIQENFKDVVKTLGRDKAGDAWDRFISSRD